MRKTLTWLLALVMVLTLGCTAFAEEDAYSELHGYESTWHNYGLSKDPITLTICVGAQDLPHAGKIDSLQNQLIQQATGITLEWVQADKEKFAVMAAGGDLPDLISHEDTQYLKDLIQAGMLLDVAPMLETYGQNILSMYDGFALERVKAIYGDGEAVYIIPTNLKVLGDYKVVSYNGSFSYYLRFDLYQAVGMPPVTDENGFNEDLYLEALKMMQDYARDVMGTDTVYALSGYNSWGPHWVTRHPYNFAISGRAGDTLYDQLTGEILPSIADEDSAWWDMIRFYNKAYRMGIFDPEAFTLTYDQYRDKLDNGEVLVSVMPRTASTTVKEMFGETAGFFCVKGTPYVNGLLTQDDPLGYGDFACDSINVNCKYPERAMALIDYLRSDEFMRATYNGIQGVDWDYNEDGVPVYIGEALAAYESQSMDDYWKVGGGHYKHFPQHKWAVALKLCEDGYPCDFTLSPEAVAENTKLDPAALNFLAAYETDARYPGELYAQWIEEGLCNAEVSFTPSLNFMPSRPENLQQIDTKCRTYISDNFARLIFAESAEESQTFIDEVRAELVNMGYDTVHEDNLERLETSAQTAAEMGF